MSSTAAQVSEHVSAPAAASSQTWRDRARYYNPTEAFSVVLSPVPSVEFLDERDRAFDESTATGLIDMDLSEALNTPYPATTPLVMSRYMRIRSGEHFDVDVHASMQLLTICTGSGSTTVDGETVHWGAGDVLMLPGNVVSHHVASEDAVAWLLTDEPALSFLQLDPAALQSGSIAPVHYSATDLRAQIEAIYVHPDADKFPGFALMLSHAGLENIKTIHPAMTMALNTLPAGESQRPHVHNAVALTMCLKGEGVHSFVDGERKDWSPFAVMVTPPGTTHQHVNAGSERMESMVLQDGGLYSYARTPGFAYAD
jgi:gentisate 1,2-dioxygenase